MTTKERIYTEIETLDEDELQQLLGVIENLTQAKPQTTAARKPGLLSRLKEIHINAPEDFSANIDQYMNGEKSIVSSDVH